MSVLHPYRIHRIFCKTFNSWLNNFNRSFFCFHNLIQKRIVVYCDPPEHWPESESKWGPPWCLGCPRFLCCSWSPHSACSSSFTRGRFLSHGRADRCVLPSVDSPWSHISPQGSVLWIAGCLVAPKPHLFDKSQETYGFLPLAWGRPYLWASLAETESQGCAFWRVKRGVNIVELGPFLSFSKSMNLRIELTYFRMRIFLFYRD